MLFYLKKHLVLELAVALVLGGVGWTTIQYFEMRAPLELSPTGIGLGLAIGIRAIFWSPSSPTPCLTWVRWRTFRCS